LAHGATALIARRLPRWILLVLLLSAELVALTPPFETYSRLAQEGFSGWFWNALLHQIRPVLITGLVATLFLSWPTATEEFFKALAESEELPSRSSAWLIAHLVLVGVLFAAKRLWTSSAVASLANDKIWLSLWVAMALPVFVTWAAAALPPRFLIDWFRRSRQAFLAGATLGLASVLFGGGTQFLWGQLQRATFRMVVLLLRLLGQTVVVNPQARVVGTPAFSVQIWEACSGLEGIGLISVFVGAYLWFYRHELRFPRALLLLPVGVIAIWLMNAVRITALILIGGWDPGVGFKGFHSVAGWLFFNLVACGVIWTSWHLGLFTRVNVGSTDASGSNPAAVYLGPLLAIIAISMVTQAFSTGFDFLYPLRVLAAGGVLLFYRRQLFAIGFSASWSAVAIGALVFAIWIAIVPGDRTADAQFSGALNAMSASAAAVWIAFRVIGAVVTVPIAEELAFRGYALRKLIASDFESVPPGRFTWLSFAVSSILFGVLHGNWIAGTLAGAAFAIALYRRGALWDAVVAHATTNAMLAAYVLSTHSWSLWN
jgi:exosortase E/protease (VPEID-CTERM system)